MKKIIILAIILIPYCVYSQRNPNISGDWDNLFDSQNLLFSTVKIDVIVPNPSDKTKVDTASGTGFIFEYEVDSIQTIPVLVTNKHVINGAISFSISMTKKSHDNRPLFGQVDKTNFTPKDKNIQWLFHPDTLVDLAISPLVPILKKMPRGVSGYAYYSILEGDIPLPNELSELKGVEEVLMIGYPIGIWDNKNNMPITRRGITATMPILDFQNRKEFVIDAACFPGSSGSPVMIVNEGQYSVNHGVRMGKRRLFMGILYGGPNYQPNGEIKIIDIPTRKDAITLFQIPLNLGYVIKSEELLDFKEILGIK